MKTLIHKLKIAGVGLCALALASVAAYACTMFPIPIAGFGTFGDTQKDQREMQAVAPYLAGGATLSMGVLLVDYSASCQPLAYAFWGTTAGGYSFAGVAEPAGGKARQRASGPTTLNLKVTYIEVNDPQFATPVTDDGGFKLTFTQSSSKGS
jgi:hypothetical protein